MTNDSKLLEKVLSKAKDEKPFINSLDEWDIKHIIENTGTPSAWHIKELLLLMEAEARAEGYEEGTYNDFIAFMHEYDLPDSQLTKGGQLFRDKLLAVRDRIYKKAQADLFKELEDELNKKLNNQHFRTTDFKFIAGYREAIKEAIQALKSSKGIE